MKDKNITVESDISLKTLTGWLTRELTKEELFNFILELEKGVCTLEFLKQLRDYFNEEYRKAKAGDQ